MIERSKKCNSCEYQLPCRSCIPMNISEMMANSEIRLRDLYLPNEFESKEMKIRTLRGYRS